MTRFTPHAITDRRIRHRHAAAAAENPAGILSGTNSARKSLDTARARQSLVRPGTNDSLQCGENGSWLVGEKER
jgi:hypothetical protein